MIRARGFSLLEVMLALVVVAIGISVLLAFSASSHRETSGKSTGNDYSLVVNEILEKYIQTTSNCAASATTPCFSTVSNQTAQAYLGATNAVSSALFGNGVDLNKTFVTINATRSDA